MPTRWGRPGRSLYARLALVLLAVVGVLGAAGGALALWTSGRYRDEAEQRLNRELAPTLLSDTGIFGASPTDEQLEHIFHTLMVVNPRIEVYLLDGTGRVVAFSAPTGRVVRERVDPAPIDAFLAGAPLPVYGDDPRRLLERAFGNLIDNALAHTPPGGRVTVSLAGDEREIEVRCEDTGEGIPAEELPHVFERFFRGRGRHGQRGGAGLGLAIARRIVELHGGRLEVESEPGRGTVFSFRLAATRADAGRAAAHPAAATPPAAAVGP